jgi:hypothetical protein
MPSETPIQVAGAIAEYLFNDEGMTTCAAEYMAGYLETWSKEITAALRAENDRLRAEAKWKLVDKEPRAAERKVDVEAIATELAKHACCCQFDEPWQIHGATQGFQNILRRHFPEGEAGHDVHPKHERMNEFVLSDTSTQPPEADPQPCGDGGTLVDWKAIANRLSDVADKHEQGEAAATQRAERAERERDEAVWLLRHCELKSYYSQLSDRFRAFLGAAQAVATASPLRAVSLMPACEECVDKDTELAALRKRVEEGYVHAETWLSDVTYIPSCRAHVRTTPHATSVTCPKCRDILEKQEAVRAAKETP